MAQRVPTTTPNLTELKRIIKKEETSGNRLPKWGIQRDLHLTSGNKPKKLYAPNLNTIRSKNKSVHAPSISERRGPKRSANKLSHDHSKKGKFVETDGIFSTGMGKISKLPSVSSNRSYLLRDRSPKSKAVPRLSNKEQEHAAFMYSSEEEESESEDELTPIIDCENFNIGKTEPDVKQEIKDEVKVELSKGQVGDSLEVESNVGSLNGKLQIQAVKIEEQNTVSFLNGAKVFDEDNPAISLIRLPENFIDIVENKGDSPEESLIHLKDLPEGQIGKIVIRKSGKMEMMLQTTKSVLKREVRGDDPEFAMLLPGNQSISMEPSIVTLGEVTEKFILTPEWNKLWDQVKREDPFLW